MIVDRQWRRSRGRDASLRCDSHRCDVRTFCYALRRPSIRLHTTHVANVQGIALYTTHFIIIRIPIRLIWARVGDRKRRHPDGPESRLVFKNFAGKQRDLRIQCARYKRYRITDAITVSQSFYRISIVPLAGPLFA